MLIFDIEGNNLREDITEVYCIAAWDTELSEGHLLYNEKYQDECNGHEFNGLLGKLTEENVQGLFNISSTVVGHNIIGYDIPIIKKFFDVNLNSKKIIDTLLLSKLSKPDRGLPRGCPTIIKVPNQKSKKVGSHSLEALGYSCGHRKISIADWSVFDIKIIERCLSDIKINEDVLNYLLDELGLTIDQLIKYESVF